MSFLSKLFYNSGRASYKFLSDSPNWIETENNDCDGLPAFKHKTSPIYLYGQECEADYRMEHKDFSDSVDVSDITSDLIIKNAIKQLKKKINNRLSNISKLKRKNRKFLTT